MSGWGCGCGVFIFWKSISTIEVNAEIIWIDPTDLSVRIRVFFNGLKSVVTIWVEATPLHAGAGMIESARIALNAEIKWIDPTDLSVGIHLFYNIGRS